MELVQLVRVDQAVALRVAQEVATARRSIPVLWV